MEGTFGLLIPFLGTTLGSFMVFLMKDKISLKLEILLSGLASGVMIAASMFSLLLPAKEMATNQGVPAWIPTSVGFVLGILFLQIMDKAVSNIYLKNNSNHKKNTMLMLAVTLHNIPEGMAVGVALAGAIMKNVGVTMAGALALAIGIAVQNFPEGAIISMPLKSGGMSKSKSFLFGVLSGVVEPIAGALTMLVTSFISSLLPYLLSFAAGAMIYVVVEELIPQSQSEGHSNMGTIGVAVGFVLMMVLDIALG